MTSGHFYICVYIGDYSEDKTITLQRVSQRKMCLRVGTAGRSQNQAGASDCDYRSWIERRGLALRLHQSSSENILETTPGC